GLRARRCLLRRRPGILVHAAVLLLPAARADPRGGPAPGRRARRGAGPGPCPRRPPRRRPRDGPGSPGRLGWGAVTFDCSVAVIAGGLSFEREVSLRSGQRVADALRG